MDEERDESPRSTNLAGSAFLSMIRPRACQILPWLARRYQYPLTYHLLETADAVPRG